MYVLGIETSCDETAAAVVRDGVKVVSNAVSSSLKLHSKYGGVIPEIASRLQLETIAQVTDTALREAGIRREDIGLVCVTSGPGLPGSLVVGLSFAKALSFALRLPLLGINHLQGHIYANFLSGNPSPKLPMAALVVSGGHTSLYLVKDFRRIKLIGSTRDDACGEAYDKVAKLLGLGYPGGPLIDKLSRRGCRRKVKFNCSSAGGPLDFSFSGIKTAVMYYLKKTGRSAGKADIAAAFQEAAVDSLVDKSLSACRKWGLKTLAVGGGVAANSRLRERFFSAAKKYRLKVYFPGLPLCMDNAAMIAGLGYQLYRAGASSRMEIDINSN